jgi:FlgD Ig-like domain
MNDALYLADAVARIEDNTIAGAGRAGVSISGADANPAVYGNQFRRCDRAVWIADGAHCRLGNLGNVGTADDGGNVFRRSARADIWNDTANLVRAEGNDFGTTDRDRINARIYDRRDNPALGLVDFDPLSGGVHPSGEGPALLALTGLAVVPARSGAEVFFTLSAAAEVSVDVLNLAGRRVATPAHALACAEGTQGLIWSGRAAGGLQAPAGRYLVRVTARDSQGRQATALCPVTLP